MKILLLLLPNLYDIFTLLMIGYAYFLHTQSQLKIPFLFACILIYVTTRVGIFAGKIVHMIIGKSKPEEEGEPMEEPADVVAKKMILGVGPQCLFIIICQVIVALFFLQNPALAKMTAPDNGSASQQQEQVQAQSEEQAQADVETEKASEDAQVSESAAKPSVAADEEGEDEEIIPAAKIKKQAVNTSSRAVKRLATPSVAKKSDAKTASSAVAQTKPNVYYDVPERTLQTAGVSAAERRAAYSNAVNAAATNVAPSNWNVSSSNNNVRVAQSAQTQSTQSSNLQTKRYPGDDNPVNVHWGYYRYAESVPGGTRVNTNATPTNGASQNNGYRNSVPANTMRSIGY